MTEQEIQNKKHIMQALISDCLLDLFDYDRRESEILTELELDFLTENNHITKKDLKKWFCDAIDKCFTD